MCKSNGALGAIKLKNVLHNSVIFVATTRQWLRGSGVKAAFFQEAIINVNTYYLSDHQITIRSLPVKIKQFFTGNDFAF